MVLTMRSKTIGIKVVRAVCLFGAALAAFLLISASHPRAQREWSVGYWIWGDWNGDGKPHSPVDLIVFDMGELGHLYDDTGKTKEEPHYRFRSIEPEKLPAAKRYAAVVRLNTDPFDKKDAVTPVINKFKKLQNQFRGLNRPFNEIQLDFDCPTASLPRYADWLGQWRRQMPDGTRLTITALLDWFNSGTAIGQVLSNVDGFVPQFYDVGVEYDSRLPQIAYFPDHSKWGPAFERFKVPYYIGLSSFGRVQLSKDAYFSQDDPLYLLSLLREAPHISINRSGERVLDMTFRDEYYLDHEKPNALKGIMIQPTAESILRGYQEARSMGPYCSGVLFFRWPSSEESLALKPDEVADSLARKAPDDGYSLNSIDADCALMECRDLNLVQNNRFPVRDRTIVIKSSIPLEYFLPGKTVKSKIISKNEMKFIIPAYNAAATIYLGSADSWSCKPMNCAGLDSTKKYFIAK
jgi:hypothetical protein